MSEPDFSGIDPLRVPEARRRIAALDAYLALTAPIERDIRRLADSIGLSRSAFFRLARVWRDHRDARLLVIGKRGAPQRDYGLDPKSVEIMRAVIGEADPDATIATIAAAIRRRCAAAGTRPPSQQTINNHARKACARGGTVSGPPRIVVGRLWFHLPMSDMPLGAMPTLLVALALPERAIIAHRVSTDPKAPPSVDDLIDEIARLRTPDAAPRPMLLEADDRRVGSAALERAGLGSTRSHKRSVQRELSKALGGRVGSLAAIHQRGFAKPATKPVLSRQDEPLPASAVAIVIDGAVDAHNAAAMTEMPAYTLEPL